MKIAVKIAYENGSSARHTKGKRPGLSGQPEGTFLFFFYSTTIASRVAVTPIALEKWKRANPGLARYLDVP
jgi:hypothetical protein